MSTYAYEQLVRALRKARCDIDETKPYPTEYVFERLIGVDFVIGALVEILADDDPKFDAEAFRKAVGA